MTEAASWAGVNPGTIRDYVARGRLRYGGLQAGVSVPGFWADELEKQWAARPGQGAKAAPLALDGDHIVTPRGRKVAFLVKGSNGRWFACPMSRESHADPVDGLDQLAGSGWPSREAALAAEQRSADAQTDD